MIQFTFLLLFFLFYLLAKKKKIVTNCNIKHNISKLYKNFSFFLYYQCSKSTKRKNLDGGQEGISSKFNNVFYLNISDLVHIFDFDNFLIFFGLLLFQ